MAEPTSTSDFITLLSVISVGSNAALLVSAVKIIRSISQMELKVNTMWGVFMRKFASREDDSPEDKE